MPKLRGNEHNEHRNDLFLLPFQPCFPFASPYAIVFTEVARVGHPMDRLSPRLARPRYSSQESVTEKGRTPCLAIRASPLVFV